MNKKHIGVNSILFRYVNPAETFTIYPTPNIFKKCHKKLSVKKIYNSLIKLVLYNYELELCATKSKLYATVEKLVMT